MEGAGLTQEDPHSHGGPPDARSCSRKPLSTPHERLVLPQTTRLPGRGQALLALRANIGAAGFAGYRGWIGPNDQLTQATWDARRYEGPRTQSLLQTTSVELDGMTLSGFTHRITCEYWLELLEKSLGEQLPVHLVRGDTVLADDLPSRKLEKYGGLYEYRGGQRRKRFVT